MQDVLVRMIEMTTDFAADGAVCILDKALAVSAIGFAHQPAHDYLVVTIWLLLPPHAYLANVPHKRLSGCCSRT